MHQATLSKWVFGLSLSRLSRSVYMTEGSTVRDNKKSPSQNWEGLEVLYHFMQAGTP